MAKRVKKPPPKAKVNPPYPTEKILTLEIQLRQANDALRQARDESLRYKRIADGLTYQLEVAQKCHQVVILAFADLHKLRADRDDRLKRGQL